MGEDNIFRHIAARIIHDLGSSKALRPLCMSRTLQEVNIRFLRRRQVQRDYHITRYRRI